MSGTETLAPPPTDTTQVLAPGPRLLVLERQPTVQYRVRELAQPTLEQPTVPQARPARPPRPPRPPAPPSPADREAQANYERRGFALTQAERRLPPKPTKLAYRPDNAGNVFLTHEYSADSGPVPWQDLPEARRADRRILVTTESGNEYYIYNDRVIEPQRTTPNGIVTARPLRNSQPYELHKTRRDGSIRPPELHERMLSDLVPGESGWAGLRPNPDGSPDKIATVEVFVGKVPKAQAADFDEFTKVEDDRPNRFSEMERMINHNILGRRRAPKLSRTERLRQAAEQAREKANEQIWQLAGRTILAGLVSLDVDDEGDAGASRGKRLRQRTGKALATTGRQAARLGNAARDAGSNVAAVAHDAGSILAEDARNKTKETRDKLKANAQEMGGYLALQKAVILQLTAERASDRLEDARYKTKRRVRRLGGRIAVSAMGQAAGALKTKAKETLQSEDLEQDD